MSCERDFKIGTRVRAFYTSQGRLADIDGEVDHIDDLGLLRVQREGAESFFAHPKQCRKLKPKPKPEVKKEPRRVWVSNAELVGVKGTLERPRQATWVYGETNPKNLNCESDDHFVEFIELLPDFVLMNRVKLAEAWDCEAPKHSYPKRNESFMFDNICKALGLGV